MSNFIFEEQLIEENGTSARITISDWIKLDCIKFLSVIPVLGTIAAIIIYVILSNRNETPKSMQSRIRADIIWALIALIITIIIGIIFLIVYMRMIK